MRQVTQPTVAGNNIALSLTVAAVDEVFLSQRYKIALY